MIVEIQCLPTPVGTADDRYRHVDAAIAVIAASGLHHEVSALGTTFEGPAERCWPVLRAVHEATLDAGADKALTIIKVFEERPVAPAGEAQPPADSSDVGPTTMASLTAEHRR